MLGDDRADGGGRARARPASSTSTCATRQDHQALAKASTGSRSAATAAGWSSSDHGKLRVVPARARKAEKDDPEIVSVDLDRVRVEVDPPAEWRQMYDEAWRLMRDHFWRADMGGRRLASGRATATGRCSTGSAPTTTSST